MLLNFYDWKTEALFSLHQRKSYTNVPSVDRVSVVAAAVAEVLQTTERIENGRAEHFFLTLEQLSLQLDSRQFPFARRRT